MSLKQKISSAILLLSAIVSIILANSPFENLYQSLLQITFQQIPLTSIVNNGLMTIFFFVVGLEIKEAFNYGELSQFRKATLPFFAALGGMLVPVALYLAINQSDPLKFERCWVPMATDIAFALGILAFVGKSLPDSVRIFLMALAIIDDLGAIVIIALIHSSKVKIPYFFAVAILLVALRCIKSKQVQNHLVYFLVGIAVWYAVHESGIHPSISGVLLAFTIPHHLEQSSKRVLEPIVNFGILPLFALTNSAISFYEVQIFTMPNLGILLGLVFGKPLGIYSFSWLSVRLRLASLPKECTWKHIFGVACLGGIGFTMSIFLSSFAFKNELLLLSSATAVVMIASTLSCIIALLVFNFPRGFPNQPWIMRHHQDRHA